MGKACARASSYLPEKYHPLVFPLQAMFVLFLSSLQVTINVAHVNNQTSRSLGTCQHIMRACTHTSMPQVVVDRLVSLAQSLLDEQGIAWEGILYVGIACPGQIDRCVGVCAGRISRLHTAEVE